MMLKFLEEIPERSSAQESRKNPEKNYWKSYPGKSPEETFLKEHFERIPGRGPAIKSGSISLKPVKEIPGGTPTEIT